MIIALLNVYVVTLILLIRLKIVRLNLFWKVSPLIVLVLLLVGVFIPMNWGAPQGDALVVRHAVSVVPSVVGEVAEVPVQPNVPLNASDVLFRIDPAPFEAAVRSVAARLHFQELRLAQMEQLKARDAGRAFDVEERQAEVEHLRAQLDGAKWNLDRTIVRAPADGYVTNVGLRKGERVANLPVMAFIDTSETIVGVAIQQISARYVKPGQDVEVTFKFNPGVIYRGKVEGMLPAISTGQLQTSGTAVTPAAVQAAPFFVRLRLDDEESAKALPVGAAGTAVIFTDRAVPTQIVRRIILRQIAILNYVNPF